MSRYLEHVQRASCDAQERGQLLPRALFLYDCHGLDEDGERGDLCDRALGYPNIDPNRSFFVQWAKLQEQGLVQMDIQDLYWSPELLWNGGLYGFRGLRWFLEALLPIVSDVYIIFAQCYGHHFVEDSERGLRVFVDSWLSKRNDAAKVHLKGLASDAAHGVEFEEDSSFGSCSFNEDFARWLWVDYANFGIPEELDAEDGTVQARGRKRCLIPGKRRKG